MNFRLFDSTALEKKKKIGRTTFGNSIQSIISIRLKIAIQRRQLRILCVPKVLVFKRSIICRKREFFHAQHFRENHVPIEYYAFYDVK